jgi:hypothetical protein
MTEVESSHNALVLSQRIKKEGERLKLDAQLYSWVARHIEQEGVDKELTRAVIRLSGVDDPERLVVNTPHLEDPRGFSFVLAEPPYDIYAADPAFLKYLDIAIDPNTRSILVLGGGRGQKEVGLLLEHVWRKRGNLSNFPRVYFTDLHPDRQAVSKYLKRIQKQYSIPSEQVNDVAAKIDFQQLDITNKEELVRIIRVIEPNIVTLYALLTIFPHRTQTTILENIYDYSPEKAFCLIGNAGPASVLNFYGRSPAYKVNVALLSCVDYCFEKGFVPESADLRDYPVNIIAEPYRYNSDKFIEGTGFTRNIPVECTGFVTYYQRLISQLGFGRAVISRSKGIPAIIENGFDSEAVPTFFTMFVEK